MIMLCIGLLNSKPITYYIALDETILNERECVIVFFFLIFLKFLQLLMNLRNNDISVQSIIDSEWKNVLGDADF